MDGGFSELIQVAGYTACIAVALGLVLWQMFPGFKFHPALVAAALVVIGGSVWWVVRFGGTDGADVASLEDRTRGVAEILRVEETALRVNKRPQVRLQLRVELPGQPAAEREMLALVPRGQAAQPGRRLWILVSPEPGAEPILDWTTAPPAAPPAPADGGVAERLEKLEDLRRRGRVSEEEYQAQRQRLLSEL